MPYEGDVSHVAVFSAKFGSEGSTSTGTSYASVADSDIAIDPQLFKPGSELYAKFIYHIVNLTADKTTYIQVYRQNDISAVAGTEKTVTGTTWAIETTDWIDFSSEGEDSFQIQLKTTAGGTAKYNSAIMILATVNWS